MAIASWVIRNKFTKEVVLETYSLELTKAINTAKYEAVPALKYLQELNKKTKGEAK